MIQGIYSGTDTYYMNYKIYVNHKMCLYRIIFWNREAVCKDAIIKFLKQKVMSEHNNDTFTGGLKRDIPAVSIKLIILQIRQCSSYCAQDYKINLQTEENERNK